MQFAYREEYFYIIFEYSMIERKKEEAVDEKSIDPYTALEKIMRLERKHMTFDYHDHNLRYDNFLHFLDIYPFVVCLFM